MLSTAIMLSCSLPAGLEVLTAMEKLEVDEDDRPRQTVSITGATVYVNPYKDEEAAEKKAAEEAKRKVPLAGSDLMHMLMLSHVWALGLVLIRPGRACLGCSIGTPVLVIWGLEDLTPPVHMTSDSRRA